MLKHAAAVICCLILIASPLCALSSLAAGQPDESDPEPPSTGRDSGEEAAGSLEQARQALSRSGAALQQIEQKILASRQRTPPSMTEQERNILLLSDGDYLTALERYNAARSDYDEAMAAWQIRAAEEESAPSKPQESEQSRLSALPFALLLLPAAAGAALIRRRARRR